MWYGERLENHMVTRAGDFVYIPADTPHLPYNRSQTEPAVAVVARTDPNEQESVVMLPELDFDPRLGTARRPRRAPAPAESGRRCRTANDRRWRMPTRGASLRPR